MYNNLKNGPQKAKGDLNKKTSCTVEESSETYECEEFTLRYVNRCGASRDHRMVHTSSVIQFCHQTMAAR